MTPPDFHGNAVPTLDTADDTGTQPYSKRKEKTYQVRKYVNTETTTFHDRPLFCFDCGNLPVRFLQYIWYLVRGTKSLLPLAASTATTAHSNEKL